MQRHIIFDLGNVLIQWDPNLVYAPYFQDVNKVKAFYEETEILKINALMDQGMPFDVALRDLANKFPQHHEPIMFWKSRWQQMIAGLVPGGMEIFNELHQAEYPLYALTNWSHETFPYVLSKYDFFSKFVDIVVSGQEKVIKPHPDIYKILLKRNNLSAEQCVFIDDNAENVKAANDLGMLGIQFISPEQVRAELQRQHIKLKV